MKSSRYEIVKILSINREDKNFVILNKKVYDMFNRPMKFITFDGEKERVLEIKKPDVPICDICNADAEYGLIELDGGEEYLTDCLCQKCMEETKEDIEREEGYSVIVR